MNKISALRTRRRRGRRRSTAAAAAAVSAAIAAVLGGIVLIPAGRVVLASDGDGEGSYSSYSYDPSSSIGPDYWKDLAVDGNQCGGASNSPIALVPSPCTLFDDYEFDSGTCRYGDYGFAINDHVVEASAPAADASGASSCSPAAMRIPRVDGVFELLQFHIHAGSEHTIDGGRFGAEIHLVHQLVDSDPVRLAVVAVFVEAAAFEDNALFSSLLAGFDDVADATAAACGTDTAPSHWWSSNNRASVASFEDDQLPIYQLVPEGSTFYRYDGSLTTPPCSEIVDWSVASIPLAVSPAQYADLAGLLLNYVDPDTCQYATAASPSGTTSRPVQDLNGRRVRHICPRGYRDPLAAGGRIALLAAAALLSAAAAASAALLWTRRRRPSPPDATRDSRESEQPFTTAFTASLTATS